MFRLFCFLLFLSLSTVSRSFRAEIDLKYEDSSKNFKILCLPVREQLNIDNTQDVLWYGKDFTATDQQKLSEEFQIDILIHNMSVKGSRKHRCYLLVPKRFLRGIHQASKNRTRRDVASVSDQTGHVIVEHKWSWSWIALVVFIIVLVILCCMKDVRRCAICCFCCFAIAIGCLSLCVTEETEEDDEEALKKSRKASAAKKQRSSGGHVYQSINITDFDETININIDEPININIEEPININIGDCERGCQELLSHTKPPAYFVYDVSPLPPQETLKKSRKASAAKKQRSSGGHVYQSINMTHFDETIKINISEPININIGDCERGCQESLRHTKPPAYFVYDVSPLPPLPQIKGGERTDSIPEEPNEQISDNQYEIPMKKGSADVIKSSSEGQYIVPNGSRSYDQNDFPIKRSSEDQYEVPKSNGKGNKNKICSSNSKDFDSVHSSRENSKRKSSRIL